MPDEPLISIIVAVLNSKATLERCIQSVVNQTYPNKELIIMDGGSTDGSVDILKRYDSKIKYWETKPDKGIYHAWNKALDHAQGDWICFIGADDFFINDYVIEQAVNYLKLAEKKEINYVYGKVAIFSHEKNKIINYANYPWPRMRELIHKGGFLFHSGSFHSHNLFARIGRFDESLRYSGDYDLIWREIKYHDAMYMDMVTICMGHGGSTISLENKENQLKEALYLYKKNKIGAFPSILVGMLIKVKLYKMLKKIMGEKAVYLMGYYFSMIRGKTPIEMKPKKILSQ